MKKELFKIEGYVLEGRNAGSFKLDLRAACKESPLYFKKAGSPYVKNLGQLLFGTPGWKGLFSMVVDREDNESADITIYLDHRASLFQSEIEDIERLLEDGLELLKKEGLIKDYEEVA